jgi:hypothetical protein
LRIILVNRNYETRKKWDVIFAPMPGLLDFIFENIDIGNLDRVQVLNHTAYISEISRQNLTLDQKVKFLSIKVRLQKRLMDLDQKKTTLNGEKITQLRNIQW